MEALTALMAMRRSRYGGSTFAAVGKNPSLAKASPLRMSTTIVRLHQRLNFPMDPPRLLTGFSIAAFLNFSSAYECFSRAVLWLRRSDQRRDAVRMSFDCQLVVDISETRSSRNRSPNPEDELNSRVRIPDCGSMAWL